MYLKHASGDLIALAKDGQFDVIVHGCNCFCTMGSGIAGQVREQIPDAYSVDQYTVRGDYNKLGTYTKAQHEFKNGARIAVVNAYTQYDFNRGGDNNDMFEYSSFALILQKLAHEYPRSRMGFPYIGMGLAGGDQETIIGMLEDFAQALSRTGGTVTLVEYQG